jgi:hypothetical protein
VAVIDPRLPTPQQPPPEPSPRRLLVARLGYATGVATATVGVYLLFGLGWTLTLGGLATAGSFLLLFDVDRR